MNERKIKKNTIFVIEASSYQLEYSRYFSSKYFAVLNITPDHLDRYPSIVEYSEAKLNMIKNQTSKDHIVYNMDDEILKKRINANEKSIHGFTLLEKRYP